MPLIAAGDGIRLFHSRDGAGPPVLFAHEFGGDWRSWDAQVAVFADRFRCIRFCARGFLPSEVPAATARYGQARSTDDLAQIADGLGLERFHLVGCSMGSYSSLMYALARSERLASLTLVGCSGGPDGAPERSRYRADLQRQIDLLDGEGGDGAVAWLEADGAYRRLDEKVPAVWRAYRDRLRHQSVEGARRTLATLHWKRHPLRRFERALRRLAVPTLLIHGDEDHPLVRAGNDYLAETLPEARLVVVPETGHLVQVEEAALFNEALAAHIGADGGS